MTFPKPIKLLLVGKGRPVQFALPQDTWLSTTGTTPTNTGGGPFQSIWFLCPTKTEVLSGHEWEVCWFHVMFCFKYF